MNEKISVLIPVYNRENFIMRSVNSIVFQAHENLEIILYDDGSTDDTRNQIKAMANEDSRIRYIFNDKNKGVGYARNQLLNLCDTKYAVWMDSDDISAPDRIELQLKAMTEDLLVFCIWENLKKKQPGTTLGFATLMFPVDKSICFDENMQFGGEDWSWIEKMRRIYPETLVDKVLYSIDFHGNRIGTWKRKLCKDWGGIYTPEDLEGLTYSEAIAKFEKRINQ